jgi:hypothetical protein
MENDGIPHATPRRKFERSSRDNISSSATLKWLEAAFRASLGISGRMIDHCCAFWALLLRNKSKGQPAYSTLGGRQVANAEPFGLRARFGLLPPRAPLATDAYHCRQDCVVDSIAG